MKNTSFPLKSYRYAPPISRGFRRQQLRHRRLVSDDSDDQTASNNSGACSRMSCTYPAPLFTNLGHLSGCFRCNNVICEAVFHSSQRNPSRLEDDLDHGSQPVGAVFTHVSRASGAMYVRSCWRPSRSEERRVGKECRSRWSPYH